jgi:putative DNA primase/helicase
LACEPAKHKPVIRGVGEAIWRRIRLVPFTVTIPEVERDDRLRSSLIAELPGILRRAVKGSQMWYRHGYLIAGARKRRSR